MASDTPELVPFSPYLTQNHGLDAKIVDRNLLAIQSAIERANATIIRQQNFINKIITSISGGSSSPAPALFPPGFDGGDMGDVFGDQPVAIPGRDGVIGRDGRPGFGMDGNDGDDGLPGPPGAGTPGAAGAAGAPGAAGPPSYLFHDDIEDGQPGPPGRNAAAIPGPAGFVRYFNITGPTYTAWGNGYRGVLDSGGSLASVELASGESMTVVGPFVVGGLSAILVRDGAAMMVL